jgi:lysozyme
MQVRNPNNARGIDVSRWQGVINWEQVKAAGYSFAIMKATEGRTIIDSTFSANVMGARSVGMAVGAYHFCRAANAADAVKEATWFISVLDSVGGAKSFEIPPVLDIETYEAGNKEGIVAMCHSWLDTFVGVTGVDPIIYASVNFARNYLDETLSKYKVWIASWGTNQPADAAGWTEWTFHQYSDRGVVPGINGGVDLNEFNGSVEDLFGYKMNAEDANKIIRFLSAGWFVSEGTPAADEFRRLANELRKVSGQPEE